MPARQENRCLHLEVQTGTCPGDGRDPDKRPKEPFRAHNRSLVQGPLQSSILSLAGLWQAQMGERERPLLAVAPRSAASSSPSLACSCQGLGNGEGATTRPARLPLFPLTSSSHRPRPQPPPETAATAATATRLAGVLADGRGGNGSRRSRRLSIGLE